MAVTEVYTGTLQPERFEEVLAPERYEALRGAMGRAASFLEGRAVWNVNSTAHGGGVAEMLRSLLAYARGAGVDARWLVIGGNPDFFKLTKRIHNLLHGASGDGIGLGPEQKEIYRAATEDHVGEMLDLVGPEDVVIVHDPQPAGLVVPLKASGATVIWRCHVGIDEANEEAELAWDFLRPFVSGADALIFSRDRFVWSGLDKARVRIIAPSIDAFSPKNQHLEDHAVRAILSVAGLIAEGSDETAEFMREDGSVSKVVRTASYIDGGDLLSFADPLVVQVSRWDRLKDPVGVIEGFARRYLSLQPQAHLVVAGPSVEAVADDPEGAEVVKESLEAWRGLPVHVRGRVHLASLPMDDGEENAAIVNALQTHASVVVQKSLAEGFGLTVSEGCGKARPVVASRVGGIQDQIEHRTSGLLLDDPRDSRLMVAPSPVCSPTMPRLGAWG